MSPTRIGRGRGSSRDRRAARARRRAGAGAPRRDRRHDPSRPAGAARGSGGAPPRSRASVPRRSGNHDIPYTIPGPVHEDLRRVGARVRRPGARPLRRIALRRRAELGPAVAPAGRRARRRSARASDSPASRSTRTAALRVVALHHHLAAPPWPAKRKKPIQDRDGVLKALVEAGAELVLERARPSVLARRAPRVRAARGSSRGSLVLATRARNRPAAAAPPRGDSRRERLRRRSPGHSPSRRSSGTGTRSLEVARRVFPRREWIESGVGGCGTCGAEAPARGDRRPPADPGSPALGPRGLDAAERRGVTRGATLDARGDHPRASGRRPHRRAPRRARAVRGLAPVRLRRRVPRPGCASRLGEGPQDPGRPRRGDRPRARPSRTRRG